MVPPRGSKPRTSRELNSRVQVSPSNPSKPSSTPMTCIPCSHTAVFTTARMTAFSPGASPPPVTIPIFLYIWVDSSRQAYDMLSGKGTLWADEHRRGEDDAESPKDEG